MTDFRAKFMKTLSHPNGSRIDMYMLRDDPLGVNIVTLGVPYGERELPSLIASLLNEQPHLSSKGNKE